MLKMMQHCPQPLCADAQRLCPGGNALLLSPVQELQRQSQAVKVQLQGLAAELEQALAEEADKAMLLAGALAVSRWALILPFLLRASACSDSLAEEPAAA